MNFEGTLIDPVHPPINFGLCHVTCLAEGVRMEVSSSCVPALPLMPLPSSKRTVPDPRQTTDTWSKATCLSAVLQPESVEIG